MRDMLEEMQKIYKLRKRDIEKRLDDFKRVFKNGDDTSIFAELSFCLLTPQSKAKICWNAIEQMMDDGILIHGDYNDILRSLKGVRFRRNKARYILQARRLFIEKKPGIKQIISGFPDPKIAREWLVKNVDGMGYKEASHFLRNIGFGEDLSILDRHILKNLKLFGVIGEIPKTLTRKKYLEIENSMRKFSNSIRIPLSHLDLLFWSKETGEIFK